MTAELIGERRIICECIRTALEKNTKWADLDKDQQDAIVRRIERSCMNTVVVDCEKKFIDRYWTNDKFVNRYSVQCSKIIDNLDPDSMVGSSFLSDAIIGGKIDPTEVANLDSFELCPEASLTEREVLAARLSQKIDRKYTERVSCPKCGGRKAEPREVQTAALDEISRFNYKCLICDHTWF